MVIYSNTVLHMV